MKKRRVSYTTRIHVIKAADAQRTGAEFTGPCTANQQASSPAKRRKKKKKLQLTNQTKQKQHHRQQQIHILGRKWPILTNEKT